MSLDLIQHLNSEGLRLFTIDNVYAAANSLGLSRGYIPRMLSNLAKGGAIHQLIKGRYALDDNLLSGSPLHEFEIANFVFEDSAIAYMSAMSFYGLTDQMPQKIYSLAFSLSNNACTHSKTYKVDGHEHVVLKTQVKNKWGIKPVFIGEAMVYITDLERTLLDGLARPEYCLGIREVLSAFEMNAYKTLATIGNMSMIDTAKICGYALDHGSIALQKRLGFVLEKIGFSNEATEKLKAIPVKAYQKLDIAGGSRGKYHKEWKIIENI